MSVAIANRTDLLPMTCRHCDNEATVIVTEIVEGRTRDLALCASCAREAGLSPSPKPAAPAVDALVESLIVANVGELAGELAGLACPVCSLKYMEYRATGRLGCPNDYEVFSKGLLPLLVRLQGASRHVGKVARRRPATSRRLRLRSELRDAVSREDYEAAAGLRDQLRLKDADE